MYLFFVTITETKCKMQTSSNVQNHWIKLTEPEEKRQIIAIIRVWMLKLSRFIDECTKHGLKKVRYQWFCQLNIIRLKIKFDYTMIVCISVFVEQLASEVVHKLCHTFVFFCVTACILILCPWLCIMFWMFYWTAFVTCSGENFNFFRLTLIAIQYKIRNVVHTIALIAMKQ